ncbi:endo-beta-N-acetylglucosaminidase [Spiroplasma turonicum]|uniref:Endo-beta-N-acetylglucosaminidase n=1 Tax=Spiroplasma turonicum TaxID=216946 RepID=A0A0K1P6E6_9MOLU|nr:hypothetical protein [Spiroplasma turonicum]AKU79774.1 endo-beta-N-acetylglucosaminidase [Spiroplasma turonicum]ALX70792.1 endo-beta-N-acetylglucosaminidase [Spiroplasma turonicum]
MKKLIALLNSTILLMPLCATAVSCDKPAKSFGTNLSEIEDYSWKEEQPYFEGYKNLQSFNKPSKVENTLKLNIKNIKNYLDYNDFNTGFKTNEDALKQSPTGVPLNSHFLPNGNLKKDLHQIDKSEIFDEENSLLDWNYEDDNDAKYNVSRIPLQKTTKVAKKWVASQNENVMEMNMSTVIPSTSKQNTIVGNNKAFTRFINNYQYNDITVSWGGAINEGIILPPAANEVHKAHLNGTKILGNIFLDGYHGLKIELLRDFIKTDSEGNYLIVDKLIDMALKYNFDGWFLNNEPNGYFSDGSIVSYVTIIEIMKQFKNKVNELFKNKPSEKLLFFSYKNNGSLNNIPENEESKQLYENSDYFLTDFGQTYNDSYEYIKEKNKQPNEVFNMYNVGAWVNGKPYYDKDLLGRFDTGSLAYLNEADDSIKGNDGQIIRKYKYGDMSKNNSISVFASQWPVEIGGSEGDKLTGVDEYERDAYRLVAANKYDDMLYTGHNRKLSEKDEGVYTFTTDIDAVNKYSYGLGHIVQENTVLNDYNDVFFTHFSTGNGIKFNSLDVDNSIISLEKYPWSNTNIADVQPTYKWFITDSKGNQLDSDKISGYYDYHNPYLKGNSLSLGSGYNDKGEITPFENIGENGTYNWWIMGSNYIINKSKEVKMIVKSSQVNNIKIIYDDSSGTKIAVTSTKNLGNGWTELSANVDSKGTIAKFGLQFEGNSGLLKIGQMQVLNKGAKPKTFDNNFNSIVSDLVISRNNGIKNYRLSFDNLLKDDDLYSYYEIYADNNDKIVRVSESNKNDYFIKNIDWDLKTLYVKVINNLNSTVKWFEVEV